MGRNSRKNYQRSPQLHRSLKQYLLDSRKVQRQHSLPATSPFEQALYPKVTNEEQQGVEGAEVHCSKEQLLGEVRVIHTKLHQKVEILLPIIFSQIHPSIKTLLTLANLENLPAAGRLRFFSGKLEETDKRLFHFGGK